MSQSSRPIDEGAALSDAEWRVMQALWDRGPCRARVVLDELEAETGWSYSTVKTLLARLVAKDAVDESKDGHVSVFAARLTRRRARGSALRRLVDRAFGGAVTDLVHHLVAEEKFGKRERARLRELLASLGDEPEPPRRRGTKS